MCFVWISEQTAIRTTLLIVITQLVVVISYRRFGTPIGHNFKDQEFLPKNSKTAIIFPHSVKIIGFNKQDGVCLVCGTSWVCVINSG